MAVLTIWLLDVDDVDATIDTVTTLAERQLVEVYDAAAVRWPAGASRPTTEQIAHLGGEHAFDNSFWGMLFGLTFFAKDLGRAATSVAHKVDDQIRSLGVGTKLTERLREKIIPGKGAVLVYSSGSYAEQGQHADEIRSLLKGIEAELLRTSLSETQAQRLTTTFGRRNPTLDVDLPSPAPAKPTPAVPEPLDLRTTYVHLDGSKAPTVPGGNAFWQQLTSGGGDRRHDRIRAGGWLVATFHLAATWTTWEMHPHGDEVISCLSGRHEFRLELPDGERSVTIGAGETVVIPRGVWHTATVHEPGDCLHLTAGRGTEVRPA